MIPDTFAYFQLKMFWFESQMFPPLFLRLIFVFSLPAGRPSLSQTGGPAAPVIPQLYSFIHICMQVYAKQSQASLYLRVRAHIWVTLKGGEGCFLPADHYLSV